ncbi:Fe-S cluster assembly protein SufD [Clostridium sp. 19966]|uniref:Fe-S cluster assembly protein SufD n=1 Tax=Clostridium sp. 19966 TaxID=2768166 RepID=UPI0028DDA850|nr:Fe-S cluster assembly protein SufD [Clostridium sp. 19966]MDT8718084.1 Fe-S cluster assembly protein SufD [Clostridium sp. 19966]
MSEMLKNINKIPVRTWNWLGVNDFSMSHDYPNAIEYNQDALKSKNIENVESFKIDKGSYLDSIFNSVDIGVSKETYDDVLDNFNTGYYVLAKENSKVKEPIIIDYSLDSQNSVLLDNNVLIAEKNSEMTVVIRYSSTEGKYFHNGVTRLYAKEGARINLIKVQLLGEENIHIDAVGAIQEQGANINYIFIELGANKTVTSCKNYLQGSKSEANIDTIYLGDKERKIDVNYVVQHLGKATMSNIKVNGVLMDKANKIFRGTLDFKKGASASKGSEEESTILLSSNVRNRSIPLLLCSEDDVQGQHAASTGRIDDAKLFYLMSRGFSEKEAKKIIIEAAFNPITQKIPLEDLREEISEFIRGRISNA